MTISVLARLCFSAPLLFTLCSCDRDTGPSARQADAGDEGTGSGLTDASALTHESEPDANASSTDAGYITYPDAAGLPDREGDTCNTAELIGAEGSAVLTRSGSTTEATDQVNITVGACTGTTGGRDVHYMLDLSRFQDPVDVAIVLEASFDATLGLLRGKCGDTEQVQCERGRLLNQTNTLTVTLDPGIYPLVIDGAAPAEHGDFRLHVSLEPHEARACGKATLSDPCEAPRPVSLTGESTWFFADSRCLDEGGSAFYELDLSAEPEPVMLNATALHRDNLRRADLWLLSGSRDSQCESIWRPSWGPTASYPDGNLLELRVTPGKYLLEVQFEESARALAVQVPVHVQVERAACPTTNDTCATAQNVDTNSRDLVVLDGDTRCNTDTYNGSCATEEAPERFYRLDLSERGERTRVQAKVERAFTSIAALLFVLREHEGGCGEAIFCQNPEGGNEGSPAYDLVLDPGVYLLGVESSWSSDDVGRFQIQLAFSSWETRQFDPCVSQRMIDECFTEMEEPDCCLDWFSPGCATVAISCGLEPEVQDCVCNSNPACCDGTGDAASCAEVLARCNYFCPEVHYSAESYCPELERLTDEF